ncbi:MAG: DUF4136 domain-containing protein [Gammaproteobacteria bacterium]
MNKSYVFLFAMMFMLLSGCSNVPTKDIQIDAQADPKANFSGYKSYAWLATAAIVNDSYGQWEPPSFDADSEIMHLIDRELRKRGMSEDSVNPDVFVAFAAGIDMDALNLKVSPETQMETLENVPQGGLVVALIDSDSGFIIWLGVVTAEVMQSPNAQTAKSRLDYAVSKLLKKLPK